MAATSTSAASVLLKALDLLSTLALVLYPFAIYAGVSSWGIGVLAPLLLAVFGLRLLRARPRPRELFPVTVAVATVGIILVMASWILKRSGWLLYYPVAVSLILLAVFGWTLLRPPSLVERLARLADPRLPPAAVAYTRNVTRVWCVFFACNALAALATCLRGDLRLWTLYNGAVSYLLIGLLMAGEWLVRRRFMSRHVSSTP
ncbi:DNA gyrase subunit B [Opitutaceae bacterium TAV4]|nr:DNA gyrase subunit B [Opitutaceae bacterium TAV4]RRJ99378.1 DNA gyrase subunit B [Opitutaceae bacterium TAV3]